MDQPNATEKKLTPLEKNMKLLADEAKRNESRLVNTQFQYPKDVIALQEYQVKVQNALSYLQAIYMKHNPPLIKTLGNGSNLIST